MLDSAHPHLLPVYFCPFQEPCLLTPAGDDMEIFHFPLRSPGQGPRAPAAGGVPRAPRLPRPPPGRGRARTSPSAVPGPGRVHGALWRPPVDMAALWPARRGHGNNHASVLMREGAGNRPLGGREGGCLARGPGGCEIKFLDITGSAGCAPGA